MLELAHKDDTGATSTWRKIMDHSGNGALSQNSREALIQSYKSGNRDFKNWQLDGVDLSECCLNDADLSQASLIGANLRASQLQNANLSQANLANATLSRAKLSRSDLSRANLSNADLVGADLSGSLARAANFSNALMLRTRLNDADCLGAIMSGINATAAQFESANLECVDLTGAAMMNANLTGASCSWANLSDSKLHWAQMPWCKLEAADLEQANLTGACLRGANLSFANLDQVILTGADLYFANISGALVPPNVQAARVSSLRLTCQTFTRSHWSAQTLSEWQQRGAIIIDFKSLPRDVLTFIRKGECNLRIYFSIPCTPNGQIALETLITHITHDSEALRILSVSNNPDSGKSVVAFFAPDPKTVDILQSTLRNKTWKNDGDALKQLYEDSCASRDKNVDIFAELDALSAHIYHIQALIPISNDDKTEQLQIRLEPCDKLDEKAQISWSSVTLPKVTR